MIGGHAKAPTLPLGRAGVRPIVRGGLSPYPLLWAPAVVLALFVDAAAPVGSLWRPLVVVTLVALLIQVFASLITRDRRIGAYVAFLAVLTLVSVEAVLLAMAAAIVPPLVGLVRTRRLGRVPWDSLTRLLNYIGAGVLAFAVFNAAPALSPSGPIATPIARADVPDIYLLMLDAYPRADTLAADFDIDNGPWLGELEGRGFDVASQSRSNYNMTQLTLPSMLAYQHVLEQVDPNVPPPEQWRSLTRAMNEARGLDTLHAAGYEVVTITSPANSTSLTSADVVIEGSEPNSFEVSLVHGPIARHVLPGVQRDLLAGAYHDALVGDFDALDRVAAERPGMPRFILAHLFTPHPPYVVTADGRMGDLAPCYPDCQLWDSGWGRMPDEQSREQLDGMLTWTNARVLQAIDAMPDDAVVVIFSDHGLRFRLDDHHETTANLFAASTPGRPGLFPDDATPINILPRILNAYAGTDLPLAEEATYWSDMTTLGTVGPLGGLVPTR